MAGLILNRAPGRLTARPRVRPGAGITPDTATPDAKGAARWPQ